MLKLKQDKLPCDINYRKFNRMTLIINHFLISYLVHTCCSLGGHWDLSVSDRYLLVPVR